MLSAAMRIGPGNIVGVTGAVTIGGPGAMFWMWFSALFGMASAFVEATLAQIYKERRDDEYVGGLTYYGQKLLGDKRIIGILLSLMFIGYAMLSVPIQTFHVFTASGAIVDTITGSPAGRLSTSYIVIGLTLVGVIAVTIFGGIKRVTAVTDKLVPIMTVLFCLIILTALFANIGRFPSFIVAVVAGAFSPEALFGGAFGVALSQGIRRGLISNEAGQGTVTMAAAVADAKHPCEQGFIQSIGVFLDTMIICTFTGFVVVAAQLWTAPGIEWETFKAAKLNVFLVSLAELIPGKSMDQVITVVVCVCYALFAFTSLLGLISFSEIAGSRISKVKSWTKAMRIMGALIFVPLGILCVLSGEELDNLWYVSDFINISLVLANIPIILIGYKYVHKALNMYKEGQDFVAEDLGLKSEVWVRK